MSLRRLAVPEQTNKLNMSKNKTKKKAPLRNLKEKDVKELTESVWKQLVGLIENEVKKPNEKSVWPRKMSILVSNGKNQVVAGKVEVERFYDVRKDSMEIGKFYGNENGFDTIEITEENGEIHRMSLESDPVFYIDFGDVWGEDETSVSSQGVVKA